MNQENNINQYRRQFLTTATTAVAGLTIAPGVLLTQVALDLLEGE